MRQRSFWSKDGTPPADLPLCFNQMPTEEFEERFGPLPRMSDGERRRRLVEKLVANNPDLAEALLPLLDTL